MYGTDVAGAVTRLYDVSAGLMTLDQSLGKQRLFDFRSGAERHDYMKEGHWEGESFGRNHRNEPGSLRPCPRANR